MKVTSDLVKIIVNQEVVSNEKLFSMLLNVADINNIPYQSVIDDVDGFLQRVCLSIRKVSDEMIRISKADIIK